MKTTVAPIPPHYLRALRALTATSIGSLDWRHAGLGVLQAYLYEGEENEMRVHIWHPELKKEGMHDHGDIHDHRFNLRSYVLCGAIVQSELEMCPVPPGYEGAWRCHWVTHARAALETTGSFHETKNVEIICDVTPTHEVVVEAGAVYEFPKRAFHRSEPRGLTVTLVEKLDQDSVPARVLSRLDAPIVHAFTDTLPRKEFEKYLGLAMLALWEV